MRLDKFVAQTTGLSRKLAQYRIRAGAIEVNHQTVTDAAVHISEGCSVRLEGELLAWPQPQYWMLHKPAGYVCATTDSEHPTVLDLLDARLLQRLAANPLQIVGRLDMDTTGLLLLTNDGPWNHRITSPNSRCNKSYRVHLAEPLTAAQVDTLQQGVQLRSDPAPTRPCKLTHAGDDQWLIELSEGRYHQVKRMFAAVGNRVVQLHRERIGAISLDPQLSPGEYRPLSADEVASV